jgi:hypothetical protein
MGAASPESPATSATEITTVTRFVEALADRQLATARGGCCSSRVAEDALGEAGVISVRCDPASAEPIAHVVTRRTDGEL